MQAPAWPRDPGLPTLWATDRSPTGREPMLVGRWEFHCIQRLDDDRRSADEWEVPLDEKLAELDRLATIGSPVARDYLRALARARAVRQGEDASTLDFRYVNARGALADAMARWEVWFDGACVEQFKSDAVRRLEAALDRLSQAAA